MENKFLVNIEGSRIEVGIGDFYEKTQALALAYKLEPSHPARGKLVFTLNQICLPVFKKSALNAAAGLIARKRKYNHISTTISNELHWLSVKQRID